MNGSYSMQFGNGRAWCLFTLMTVFACGTGWATTKSITVSPQTSATVGVANTVTFTALDSNGKPDPTYTGTGTVSVSPGPTLPATLPNPLSFTKGVATLVVQFMSAGVQTITLSDLSPALSSASFSATANVSTATTSASALSGCATCFASAGAGTLLVGKYPDYNVSSNILEATHVGISTPSFVAGVAYKLPLHDFYGYNKLGCGPGDLTTKTSDARIAFCYPYKAFVNLKFTPDASQTFNGFTFGLSHALHQYLDIMVGVAYSSHNEVSPGFQQAAVSVVKAQQAAGNPYYSQFNLAALQANTSQTAFDGFPTQLLNANGTTGSLIYSGNVTVSHYRPGLFLGISIPLGFKSPASGSQ
jgi:hypothetical protein